jgi:ribosome-associated translation inhibitor RaiA
MLVQVNTGNGIDNTEALQRWASEHLNETLDRFQQEITRIEVQLSDENSGKGGDGDKRCMLEARLASHQPVAVNHHGETQDEAFRGAARKLLHALDHTLGKLRDHHRDRDSIRKDATPEIVPGAPG